MTRSSIALASTLFSALTLHQPSADAAQPVLKGNWEITFCTNPDKACTAKVCVQFTRVPGQVNTMPISGTWTMTGFAITGRWVQYGDVVQFFSRYSFPGGSSFTGMLNGDALMGGISFVDAVDDFSAANTGTWQGRKKGTCAAPSAARAKLLASDPD